MPETEVMFRRVREAIYYRRTAKLSGEIIPGIWERAELVDRLGDDRVGELERAGVIEDPRAMR